jgi:hypothetical protein
MGSIAVNYEGEHRGWERGLAEARETYGGEIHFVLFFEVYVVSIGDCVAAAGRVVPLDFGKDSCIADGEGSEDRQEGQGEPKGLGESEHVVAFWCVCGTWLEGDSKLVRRPSCIGEE